MAGMALSDKQGKWLTTAWLVTARHGPVFARSVLRGRLGITLQESEPVARSLQAMGLVVLLPNDEAMLTRMPTRFETSVEDPWLNAVLISASEPMRAIAIEQILEPAR